MDSLNLWWEDPVNNLETDLMSFGLFNVGVLKAAPNDDDLRLSHVDALIEKKILLRHRSKGNFKEGI